MKPKFFDEVPPETFDLFTRIRSAILALPREISAPAFICGIRLDKRFGSSQKIPNCHIVARAVGALCPVDVHDGYVFGRNYDGRDARFNHSWLTHSGYDPRIIIDPWPLGTVSGPALFVQGWGPHFGPESPFLEQPSEEFQVDVEAVTQALRLVM